MVSDRYVLCVILIFCDMLMVQSLYYRLHSEIEPGSSREELSQGDCKFIWDTLASGQRVAVACLIELIFELGLWHVRVDANSMWCSP